MATIETYIYSLSDPLTGEVRYVGKSNDVTSRVRGHLNDRGSTRKARWIQSLLADGRVPIATILEVVTGDKWQDAEAKWIAHYRSLGKNLCNHTDGGEGLHNPTQDTRKRIGLARRAEWDDPVARERKMDEMRSPERRRKISLALSGKKKSPEHIASLPQNQAGRKLSPDHAEKSRAVLREHGYRHPKGVPMTDEVKAKIRDSLRGNSHTLGRVMPESEKRQRSETQKGKPKTAEHREKIRLGALRRWRKDEGT